MRGAAKARAADVHKEDVKNLLAGKVWLGILLFGQFRSGYSLTVNAEQAKEGARVEIEGSEVYAMRRQAAPPGTYVRWRMGSTAMLPFASYTLCYTQCSLLLDPAYVEKMLGEGCSRSEESLELYSAAYHSQVITNAGFDPFLMCNGETQIPLYRAADAVVAEMALQQWEQGMVFANEAGSVNMDFLSFPLIYSPSILVRILSLFNLSWQATEAHGAWAKLFPAGYEIEREGRVAFFATPATMLLLTKALIAYRLPYTVDKAEVLEFLCSSDTRRQLADLLNVIFTLAQPLSVICCVCAQHIDDGDLAAVYGKSELARGNPNPAKQLQAHRRLAIVQHQHEQAEEEE